jgi:inosine-uridine nucleoside N-ribohydrolase
MEQMNLRPRLVQLVRTAGTVALILTLVPLATAHDDEQRLRPVVVDSDLGVDDVVALAMALQHPDLDLAALVASEGVADAAGATEQLGALASFFNRNEIPLYPAAPGHAADAPPWRERASQWIGAALAAAPPGLPPASAGTAYTVVGERTTVVVLGPLTHLAAEMTAGRADARGVGRLIVAGDPEDAQDWNLSRDAQALAVVRASGVPVAFVRPGTSGAKPEGWYTEGLTGGQGTALGERLLDQLLAAPEARAHYLQRSFHDELAMLYLLRPELFTEVGSGIFEPTETAAAAVADALSHGRQHKDRVVFTDGPLPESALRPDVRARRAAILANNGEDEWFAQLLLNELHEHLGAYSIIGVKMGLRAAELLNAPQHSMTIVSSTPASQPVSCLNDGLLVSTGSTPGRGLFSHEPGAPGTVEASFSHNGRRLTLRLKEEYRAHIRSFIQSLLARTSLDDDAYWHGVRELGLDIWQNWHRRDLFEVVSGPAPATVPDGMED